VTHFVDVLERLAANFVEARRLIVEEIFAEHRQDVRDFHIIGFEARIQFFLFVSVNIHQEVQRQREDARIFFAFAAHEAEILEQLCIGSRNRWLCTGSKENILKTSHILN
jgi:hypothetical protein